MQTRDEYIAKMKLQLDELNVSIGELEARLLKAKDVGSEKYKAELAALRQQSQLAIDKFNELRAASENSWESLVEETEKVRDAFVRSYHYFKSQL